MKNTFSPIELQVISNVLNGKPFSRIETQMLREKIERLKANPPTLRETAKQYVADLINGVITDPNPQRLEAAKTVLEYSAFDDEQEPAESESTSQAEKDYLFTHEPPIRSERIKGLDCSTPTDWNPDQVVKVSEPPPAIKISHTFSHTRSELADALKKPVAGGPVRQYAPITHEQFFGAPYPTKSVTFAATLESGTGGPVVLDEEPKTFDKSEYEKVLNRLDPKTRQLLREGNWTQPKPMTLERAVAVLNEHKYGDCDHWQQFDPLTVKGPDYSGRSMLYPNYVIIAIAEKLEREK